MFRENSVHANYICIWTIEGLEDWKIIIDISEFYTIKGNLTIGNGRYDDGATKNASIVARLSNSPNVRLRTIASAMSEVWIKLELYERTSFKFLIRQERTALGMFCFNVWFLLVRINEPEPNLVYKLKRNKIKMIQIGHFDPNGIFVKWE